MGIGSENGIKAAALKFNAKKTIGSVACKKVMCVPCKKGTRTLQVTIDVLFCPFSVRRLFFLSDGLKKKVLPTLSP
jgi:hypothetical protein